MSDMTIQNAIHCMKAIICEEVCEECDYYGKTGTDHCEADAVRMAIKALEEQPRWIPCSERMPEDGERVLCTHLGGLNPNRQVIEHIYQSGQFTSGWEMDTDMHSPTFGQRYMGKVIAWMPQPKPYRGEDK